MMVDVEQCARSIPEGYVYETVSGSLAIIVALIQQNLGVSSWVFRHSIQLDAINYFTKRFLVSFGCSITSFSSTLLSGLERLLLLSFLLFGKRNKKYAVQGIQNHYSLD